MYRLSEIFHKLINQTDTFHRRDTKNKNQFHLKGRKKQSKNDNFIANHLKIETVTPNLSNSYSVQNDFMRVESQGLYRKHPELCNKHNLSILNVEN